MTRPRTNPGYVLPASADTRPQRSRQLPEADPVLRPASGSSSSPSSPPSGLCGGKARTPAVPGTSPQPPKAGVRNQFYKPERDAFITQLWKSGWKSAEIAKRVGITQSSVIRRLDALGLRKVSLQKNLPPAPTSKAAKAQKPAPVAKLDKGENVSQTSRDRLVSVTLPRAAELNAFFAKADATCRAFDARYGGRKARHVAASSSGRSK